MHPKIAEIIKAETNGPIPLKAFCPFCKSQMRVNIPHAISCSNCKNKLSIYPKEVKDVEREVLRRTAEEIAKGKLPSEIAIPSEEIDGHSLFDTMKFRLTAYGGVPTIKWTVEIVQNYNLNKSCISSFKGRPFQLELDSLISLDYSNMDAMIKKINVLLMFR